MSFHSATSNFSDDSCQLFDEYFPFNCSDDINDFYGYEDNVSYLDIEQLSYRHRNEFPEQLFRRIPLSRRQRRHPSPTNSCFDEKPVYSSGYDLGLENIKDLFLFKIIYDNNDRFLYNLRYIFEDVVRNDFIPESSNGYILNDELGDFLEISNLFYIILSLVKPGGP